MKKSLLFLLLALFSVAAMAKPVDPNTAQRVATNFWNAHRDNGVASITSMQMVDIPFDGFYLFTAGEKGFVFVAADDCVQPILGYSFTSPAGNRLNREVKYWLAIYQQQIDYLRENGIAPNGETAAKWEHYLSLREYEPQSLDAVNPLLSTTWDQDPLYNNLCPYDATAQERTVTGCVATATAQVMKYWNHPTQGTGSHNYNHSLYGYQSANFGATTYQWEQMPNALNAYSTTAQINAVATLMYHVGVAIEMDYGTSSVGGSAAYTNNYGMANLPCAQNALPAYFGYLPINCYYRDDCSDAQWASYLNTELNASRPVIYAGQDTAGGHCFVCDGYNNSNMYHFNWGWGGYQDGYYSLSNLAPGTGGTGGNATYTFNLSQRILTGVQPDSNYVAFNPFTIDPDCIISSFPYEEDFDDTNSYGCLRVYNANNDNVTWGLSEDNGVNSSVCAMISYAYDADDYLILPGIASPGNYTFSWQAKIESTSYPETYQVIVGDYTIFQETLNSTSFVSRSASFTVAPGDTVLPMFRYISDDKYVLYIDDITISVDTSSLPPIPTTGDTISWCEDEEYVTSVGTGTPGQIYWGISLLPSQLAGHNYLKSVLLYVPSAGTYNLKVYSGGTTAPLNQTHMQSATFTNSQVGWQEIILNNSYTINQTQTLWITFSSTDVGYPASSCNYVNSLNSDWASLDGISWDHLQNISSTLPYSWLIKAVTSESLNPIENYTITVVSANPTMGSVSGGGSFPAGTNITISASANAGYHFTQWNDGNSNASRSITVTGDATYTASFAANSSSFSDTVSYCGDDEYVTSIGTGNQGGIFWGICLTPTQLSGRNYLKSVLLYVTYAGNYTLKIYTGGTSAPNTLALTKSFVVTDDQYGWKEIALDPYYQINQNQNLWLTFTCDDVDYPAASCAYANDPNSDWASLDGVEWDHLSNFSSTLNYSWLIKAVSSQSSGPAQNYTITVVSADATMGSVSGGGTYPAGTSITISATAKNGYHFTQWNDGNSNASRSVTVTGNATYTAYFAPNAAIDGVEVDSWKVFPNPATSTVYIEGNMQSSVTLIDVTGRSISTLSMPEGRGSIDVSMLAPGTYFLRISSVDNTSVHKLFVK